MRASLKAALVLMVAAQSAQASDGFLLQPLSDVVAGSQFGAQFATHQYSYGTTVNQRGNLIGWQRTATGQLKSFNVTQGTNPSLVIVDSPDFMALAAGEPVCVWIFCTAALPWGVMITAQGGVGQFIGRDPLLAPLPGSLPDTRFPGALVNANRHGVVATSQIGDDGRYGAVLFPSGPLILNGLPLLVAINDNVPAQILAHDGTGADCLIDGIGCEPAPVAGCDGSQDTHKNTRGKGHQSHGRGHGYGHYRCGPGKPGSDSYLGLTAATTLTSVSAGSVAEQEGYLVTVSADGEQSRLRFPTTLASGETLVRAFPLALNQRTAILRADIHGAAVWPGRLVRCDFNPLALDTNGDGVVDCLNGVRSVEAPETGVEVHTVLGFSLNSHGLLIGNAGFGGAGVGSPFRVQLDQVVPQVDLLSNRMVGAENWELASVSDLNDGRRAIGYGYQDCGDRPRAVVLSPLTGLSASMGFRIGRWLQNTAVIPGQAYTVAPQAQGGSGQYLYRYSVKSPGAPDWTLLQDWSASPLQAVAAQQGELCYRIELTDAVSSEQRQLVLRYRVTPALANPSRPALP
ncbi:MAG: hypothetical protein ACK4SX_06295 [Alcanivoracaceae bacterium]